MVTIKDIAKESGYSISTVSRVLNHRTDVSPEAKRRIEKIVAQYNFVPNNNAKQLKQTASRTIGVIVKGTSNVLFHGIVEAIQQIVEKTTYTTDICYLDEDENEVEHAILMCRERKPIGIMETTGDFMEDWLKKWKQELSWQERWDACFSAFPVPPHWWNSRFWSFSPGAGPACRRAALQAAWWN